MVQGIGTVRNGEKQGKAEQTNPKRERLRKYELFFNQARVGLVIGTAAGNRLEFMNPYFAELHGYTVKELTGRPFADLLAPNTGLNYCN